MVEVRGGSAKRTSEGALRRQAQLLLRCDQHVGRACRSSQNFIGRVVPPPCPLPLERSYSGDIPLRRTGSGMIEPEQVPTRVYRLP